jgi:hypothetical protein
MNLQMRASSKRQIQQSVLPRERKKNCNKSGRIEGRGREPGDLAAQSALVVDRHEHEEELRGQDPAASEEARGDDKLATVD